MQQEARQHAGNGEGRAPNRDPMCLFGRPETSRLRRAIRTAESYQRSATAMWSHQCRHQSVKSESDSMSRPHAGASGSIFTGSKNQVARLWQRQGGYRGAAEWLQGATGQQAQVAQN